MVSKNFQAEAYDHRHSSASNRRAWGEELESMKSVRHHTEEPAGLPYVDP